MWKVPSRDVFFLSQEKTRRYVSSQKVHSDVTCVHLNDDVFAFDYFMWTRYADGKKVASRSVVQTPRAGRLL